MGINSESDTAANLVIGPTSHGMVRIFVEAEGIELPMDFDPDEALEIAEELRASAQRAGLAPHAPGALEIAEELRASAQRARSMG
ncbi:MAG TPA: DUF6324 family protein, partial [Thermohalobaculum sp.]|nr:DUF6324 family protein [Thermohalobaculum sp.]